MHHLILVRHATPVMDSARPARMWQLSEEGRSQCIPLAKGLTAFHPEIAFTSTEPKAKETGEILARHLQIPCQTAQNLHEHERENTPLLATRNQFLAAVETLFKNPRQRVFGEESGEQALSRFNEAIHKILKNHPRKNILVASHGTVISLFTAKYNHINAYEFWQKLAMPDMVVLSLPGFSLISHKW